MRVRELNVPDYLPRTDEERQVNNYDKVNGCIEVHLPVFNYAYSDNPVTLNMQAAKLKRDLIKVKKFFIENSYSRFTIKHKIVSAQLSHPKNWLGNMEGIEPKYDSSTGDLIDPDDMVSLSDYTGYGRLTIYKKDPGRFSTGNGNSIFRNYNTQFLKTSSLM